MRWLLVLALCQGCLHDPSLTCGDLTCPAGLVCTPGGCARPEEAAACEGRADYESCGTNGACLGGACHPITCGDAIRDLGEVCDDGNQRSGDGCSSDCLSIETCGNGVVDSAVDEQCDDGNTALSSTGCSSTCTLEFRIWQDVTPIGMRSEDPVVAAYDSQREVTVVFGRDATGAFTMEWDGTHLIRRSPPTSPPAMFDRPVMEFHPDSGRTILFGGRSSGPVLGDTWQWDGLTWEKLVLGTQPPPRYDAGIAYDQQRRRLVMFGGEYETNTRRDTWEWNGSTWVNATPADLTGQPPSRRAVAMAFDGDTNRVMMFGGWNASDNLVTPSTWFWAGSQWVTGTCTPGCPPKRAEAAMASNGSRVIMFGGRDDNDFLRETWRWNDSATNNWFQLTPASGPSARGSSAMVYDSKRGTILAIGGRGSGVAGHDDIWEMSDGTAEWYREVPNTPPSMLGAAGVFDRLRGRTVRVGTDAFYFYYPQWCQFFTTCRLATWEFDGVNWIEATTTMTSPSPGARRGHRVVFDEARGRVVMFGGKDPATQLLDDLWTWDGTTGVWTPQSAGPGGRENFAMAYDVDRQVTIVFGGAGDPATWEWNGTAWSSQVVSGPDPGGRWNAVYDRARKTTVVFGSNAETWTWNGSAWTRQMPAVSPPQLVDFSFTYDLIRNVAVLYSESGQVWEWDGLTWQQIVVPGSPPSASSDTVLVYDAVHRRSLLSYGNSTVFALPMLSLETQERCLVANEDNDNDGLPGCADPDCFGRCSPLCPPGATCTTGPRCGDNQCGFVEDRLICPQDCP